MVMPASVAERTLVRPAHAAAAASNDPIGLRLARVCVLLAVALAPLVFSTQLMAIFTLDKIALVRVLIEIALAGAVWGGLHLGVWAWPAVIYAVALLAATLAGRHPAIGFWGGAESHFGVFTLLHGLVLLVLVAALFREAGQQRRLVVALIAGSAPVAGYAWVQRLGLDPMPWAGFDVHARPFGTLGNATYLGTYLVFLLPLTVAWARAGQRPAVRLLLAALLLGQTGALLFCQTRGAWLGAAGALVTLACLTAAAPGKRSRRPAAVTACLAAGVLAVGAIAALSLGGGALRHAANPYVQRLASITDNAPGSSGWRRLEAWRTAWGLVTDSVPAALLGYGPESYTLMSSRRFVPGHADYAREGEFLNSTHNVFFDTLHNAGLLGLLALLALLGQGVVGGMRVLGCWGVGCWVLGVGCWDRKPETQHPISNTSTPVFVRSLAAGLVAAVVGYAIQGMFLFDHITGLVLLCACLGLLIALGGTALTPSPSPNPGRGEATARPDSPRPGLGEGLGVRARWVHRAAVWIVTALVGYAVVAFNVHPVWANALAQEARRPNADGGRDLERAGRLLRRAVVLAPDSKPYWLALADVHGRRAGQLGVRAGESDLRRAEGCLRKLLALDPGDVRSYYPAAAFYRYWGRLDAAKYAEADRLYRAAARLSPTRPSVLWAWGEMALDWGRSSEALDHFRAAVALDPSVALPHARLGECCARLGRLDEAEAEYAAAWRRWPTGPAAPQPQQFWVPRRLALAEAFLGQGHRSRAAAQLRAALEADPHNAKVEELLDQIVSDSRPPGEDDAAAGRASGVRA